MAKTPRSFRKAAYSRLDVTRRTGLEDGCWAHCGDGGNIVPCSTPLIPLWTTGPRELEGLSGCVLLLFQDPREDSHVRGLTSFQSLQRDLWKHLLCSSHQRCAAMFTSRRVQPGFCPRESLFSQQSSVEDVYLFIAWCRHVWFIFPEISRALGEKECHVRRFPVLKLVLKWNLLSRLFLESFPRWILSVGGILL